MHNCGVLEGQGSDAWARARTRARAKSLRSLSLCAFPTPSPVVAAASGSAVSNHATSLKHASLSLSHKRIRGEWRSAPSPSLQIYPDHTS